MCRGRPKHLHADSTIVKSASEGSDNPRLPLKRLDDYKKPAVFDWHRFFLTTGASAMLFPFFRVEPERANRYLFGLPWEKM